MSTLRAHGGNHHPGFKTSYHFSLRFKANTGRAPTQICRQASNLLQQVSTLLQLWQANGIAPLCLTDIALTSYYYADLGLRPIRTCQFLLRPTQLDAAS